MSLYNYDDIFLVPRKVSKVKSRSEVDLSVDFLGHKLKCPILASPMPDIGNPELCNEIAKQGGLGFLHRFCSTEDTVLNIAKTQYKNCGFAIECGEQGYTRFQIINVNTTKSLNKVFLIDVANAANSNVKELVNRIKKTYLEAKIVVGNVGSYECFSEVASWGVDAIRVSIGSGSHCTTKIETGVYCPSLFSLIECRRGANEFWQFENNVCKTKTLIIADGGISKPADVCKALIWADVVMLGGQLAGCKESLSKTLRIDDKLFKIFRGAASYSTQIYNKKEPKYIEGMESLVQYSGPLEKTITRYCNGLRSCLSYFDSKNLNEYKHKVTWESIH